MNIDITRALQTPGWMSEQELRFLAERASEVRSFVEAGSWKGRSTIAIAMHVQDCCVAIDTFAGTKDPRNGHYDGGHIEAEELNGDRIYDTFMRNTWDLQQSGKLVPLRCRSENGAALVRDLFGTCDCCFLDAAHDPEGVQRDIRAFLPLLKPGGLLLGHDALWPGLWDAVTELLPDAKVVCDSIWSWRKP